ncbi:GNAT family N-acetyltransferase [Lentibacillus cibarius]|uniref:GNAT family N-acetyltransferase n=1 Tax=Lentibacillus cibarius TaxID=2583219 RepID=A0A549YHI9_9BACI|nr:GNAT family N-acetyltransferase [Lentibacillus cibarius]TRM11334.1 GNAT family N-acetyltransferase [Lentibacillus cibarius]
MKWYIKTFDELSNEELYAILKLRVNVFVVEQDCPYPELDDYDQASIHYFFKIGNEIAANVRIVPAGTKYPVASIGRVVVNPTFRGNGYGREIMRKAIDYTATVLAEPRIKIQGQEYLERFYTELGFRKVSDSYLEDGIPHVDMIWDVLETEGESMN